jgi:hypothetical protein
MMASFLSQSSCFDEAFSFLCADGTEYLSNNVSITMGVLLTPTLMTQFIRYK